MKSQGRTRILRYGRSGGSDSDESGSALVHHVRHRSDRGGHLRCATRRGELGSEKRGLAPRRLDPRLLPEGRRPPRREPVRPARGPKVPPRSAEGRLAGSRRRRRSRRAWCPSVPRARPERPVPPGWRARRVRRDRPGWRERRVRKGRPVRPVRPAYKARRVRQARAERRGLAARPAPPDRPTWGRALPSLQPNSAR
jgi:hypothetical protein